MLLRGRVLKSRASGRRRIFEGLNASLPRGRNRNPGKRRARRTLRSTTSRRVREETARGYRARRELQSKRPTVQSQDTNQEQGAKQRSNVSCTSKAVCLQERRVRV